MLNTMNIIVEKQDLQNSIVTLSRHFRQAIQERRPSAECQIILDQLLELTQQAQDWQESTSLINLQLKHRLSVLDPRPTSISSKYTWKSFLE